MIPVRILLAGTRRRLYVATQARKVALTELAEAVRGLKDLDAWRLLEDAAKADDAAFAKLRAEVDGETKPGAHGEPRTFGEMADEWTSGRAHERFPDHVKAKDHAQDKRRLAVLCRVVGDVPLARFTLDDAERAMRAIPKAAKTSATRRHYGQAMARVLAIAEYPYRLIARSPLPRKFLPRIGKPPEFPYLRPAEDTALCGCAEVPLERRLLWGLLAREGMRLSEALSLRFRGFDPSHGTISVERAKTRTANTWKASPGAVSAVRAVQSDLPDERAVFGDLLALKTGLARVFRDDLQAAKVKRAELHDRSDVRRPIRVHDLRGTAVTLWLAAGRSEAYVQDRTGRHHVGHARALSAGSTHGGGARPWGSLAAGLGPRAGHERGTREQKGGQSSSWTPKKN